MREISNFTTKDMGMVSNRSESDFPLSQPESTPDETSFAGLVGKRVIIVEDEGVTQMQLRRTLRSAGLEVIGSATNAEDGVALVLEQRPEIVLMDIRMPGKYDGLEGARRILAEYSVCILMLTAFSDESYRQKAQDAHVSGYVLKPVTAEILLPQIANAMRNFGNN